MRSSITGLDAPVVFFPVRHHSPACARLVSQLARDLRPAVILVEGPSDFNDRIGELSLPHQLPIAIYSYVQMPDGRRRGAFYPFCVHSPEWQAIQIAGQLGAAIRFIDLPWADVAAAEIPSHRYADDELRESSYVSLLCDKMGVESLDDVWDTLFEIEWGLGVAHYLDRCHRFCYNVRVADGRVSTTDHRREAFMAAQIRQAMEEYAGQILVVTGGFHSYALYAKILDIPFEEAAAIDLDASPVPAEERGIALTPYSYQRLDSLTGYEAGMPNPGFYHQVWEDTRAGERGTYRKLLAQAAAVLRGRGQAVSAADLIAVEATAQGLAALRGHEEVWRRDLVDGIVSALIKDEIAYGQVHPFLDAVYDVFRGDARGYLAAGAELPPLVHDIRLCLHEHDLDPRTEMRTVELDLFAPEDLARSRVLHRLYGLGIAGYVRAGGSDLVARTDLSHLWEQWNIQWSPDLEANCIEAALYGPTLADASGARLLERAIKAERDAEKAARILLDASLMGLDLLAASFYEQLTRLIRQDSSFIGVTGALGHLLYLYRYDEVLGTAGLEGVGALLIEAFRRGLWLLEGLGQAEEQDQPLLRGVSALLETVERCAATLPLDRGELVDVLKRVSVDAGRTPVLRGAVTGALWTLGEAATDQLVAGMHYFAAPSMVGDYLAGLFHLAREAAQRQPELILSLDELLAGYDDEEFLEALPALRLAFSYFAPREKYHMARTLFQEQEADDAAPVIALEVSPETAARVLAFETRLFQVVERYGLQHLPRGGAEGGDKEAEDV